MSMNISAHKLTFYVYEFHRMYFSIKFKKIPQTVFSFADKTLWDSSYTILNFKL